MNYQKLTYTLLAAAVLINFSGLFVTIIGTDGTLYATVAKTMALNHNYTHLFAFGTDWLDKPHLPFWLTAFCFQVFGIHGWSYKLPGILCMLMGAYYTYLFARALYNKEIALWSAIILLTAQHIILSNNDVRAEPYLTGFIIASIYHFYKTNKENRTGHLVAGAFFAALAIMTKGMFALVPICGAIGGELIMKKRWKQLFHPRWIVAALLILLFITPELYSLYIQFDLHPEKIVFGQQGVSGLRFFFWDSQFGRFFNSGPIKGKGDKSFFFHTLLWAFLPWSLLLYATFMQWFRKNFRNPFAHEWYCFYGSLATFVLFSLSRFQLPHYLNIIFPLFAIMTAKYLFSLQSGATLRRINITQTIIAALLVLLVMVLSWFFQPEEPGWFSIVLLVIAGLALLWVPNVALLQKILYRSVLTAIFITLFLNGILYPDLLRYQSGSEAGRWINKNYPGIPVAQFRAEAYSSPLDFYLDKPLILLDSAGALPDRPFILYQPAGATRYQGKGDTTMIKQFDHYPISRLTPKFLNNATRREKVAVYELVLIR